MTKLTVIMVPFNPLGMGGSSYSPMPRRIANKHAVVNVKILCDDMCFKWAMLSALFPATHHADRLLKYVSHKNAIDCSSLQFTVDPKQFSVFERDNPDIALHCLVQDDENKCFSILYLSPHMHLRSKISLLLLDSSDGRDLHHYVWVKNLSHLVTNRHRHARHVCMFCLQAFTLRHVLEQHEPNCLAHASQQCVCPSRGKAARSFNMHHCEFPFDFYLVADFECFLRPSSTAADDEPNVDICHVPSGFCVFRVTDHELYSTDPVVYSGDDVMGKFFSYIFTEVKAISCRILSCDVPMATLSASEEAEFASTTNCANCKRSFSHNNIKT